MFVCFSIIIFVNTFKNDVTYISFQKFIIPSDPGFGGGGREGGRKTERETGVC